MIDNDENVKVTQELMSHSHSKTTLDRYAKAVTPNPAISGTKKEMAELPQAMAAVVGCVSVDF
jgi:hypothetical protein